MYGNAQIAAELGASLGALRRSHEEMMARKILLVLADPAQAKVVRRSLIDSRESPLEIEWVNRCGDAVKRLGSAEVADIAAVMVDLFLPDSQGIETFDELFRVSPQIPILILSRLRHEDIARLALRRGAQEYLLGERFHGDVLTIALTKMLERSARDAAVLLERDRAQVTLDSIGDGVISIDVAGNIAYLNPIAPSSAKAELLLANTVRQLNPGERDLRGLEGLESQHRGAAAFDGSMVLLDDIVQIPAVAHSDILPSRVLLTQQSHGQVARRVPIQIDGARPGLGMRSAIISTRSR